MASVLTPERALSFATEVLETLGMPKVDAAIAAESMVWAGLRGAMDHSLIRLCQISDRAKAGGLSLTTDWTAVRQQGSTTVLDAAYVWGTVAGTHGMRHAIRAARSFGVGMTSVRNCDVTSILGWYSSRALAERMIGIAISNGPPVMAAWGGADRIMGNQAFSIACPAGTHAPVVVDMGMGAARLSSLVEAAIKGSPLPAGVAVDVDGASTIDARRWRDGGSLLPMGGHRGYGLALMWEVVTGVLSGGQMLTEVGAPDEFDRRVGCSLFLVAIDPSAFVPYETFAGRVDQLVDRALTSPVAPGFDRIRIPGERGAVMAEERERSGIPFSGEHVRTLRALAVDLGVRQPW